MSKGKILILDGQNLAYRSYFSLSKLNNGKKKISIIYGLPKMVGSLVKKFEPTRVYLVWDGQRSAIRIGLHPGYKARDKQRFGFDAEDFYDQRRTVMKLFYALGIKQVYNKNTEADDEIYRLVRRFEGRKIIIASNDKDFHQLINNNVRVYNAKDTLLTPGNLSDYFDYSPDRCVDYLCLVGDDSDKIKGYRGIGPAKGKAFFQEHSSINEFLQSNKLHKQIDKEKLALLYATNRQLIDLQYYYEKHNGDGTTRFYKNNAHPEFDKASLFRICDEYQIISFRKKQFLRIWTQ